MVIIPFWVKRKNVESSRAGTTSAGAGHTTHGQGARGVSRKQHLLKNLGLALDQQVKLLLLLGRCLPEGFRGRLLFLEFVRWQKGFVLGVFHLFPFLAASPFYAPDAAVYL